MTIKRFAGDKITGLSSDTKPTTVNIGATFYETDTFATFVYDGSNWNGILERNGTVISPINSGDSLIIDTINEQTVDSGVVVEGVSMENGAITMTDSIQFDITGTGTTTEGNMAWDSTEIVPCIGIAGGYSLPILKSLFKRVKNDSGVELPIGTVVYISGSTGSSFANIKMANANSITTSYVLGMVYQKAISVSGFGIVVEFGYVKNVNTDGLAYGTPVWLATTDGQFTTTRPDAPNTSVFLGYVIRAHATEGSLAIRPTVIPRMTMLSDVYTEIPTIHEILQYNSVTSRFELTDSPTFANLTDSGLTVSRVVVSGTGGILSSASTTTTQVNYLSSATGTTGTTTGKIVFDTAPTFITSITTPSVLATTNDSGALGASGTAFSDLFLASGGVINWNSGNATITHSTGLLVSNVQINATDFKIPVQSLGTPTYSTINDFCNSFGSAGRKTGGVASDAGSSKVAVTAGTGFIKATDDDNAQLMFCNWSAPANITIPASSSRYIGVEYNSGIPQIVTKTSSTWDYDTEFPLARVVNETINGAEELYVVNTPWWVTDGMTNIIQAIRSFGLVRRDDYVGGLMLSATGTRNIAVSSGTVWAALNDTSFAGIDTSVTGIVEGYWYKAGSGWQKSDLTQWSKTQWNDVTKTSLQTIDNNKYCNVWIYGEMTDSTISIALIYPQVQYNTAAEAEATKAPSNLPTHISQLGMLFGRYIIKQNVDTPVSVQSAFTTTFGTSVATLHSNLGNLAWTSSGHTGTASNIAGFDGTGVASFYTTTGTGTVLVLATSPSFTTPSLGVATTITINGNTITTGTGTLTLNTYTLTVAGTTSVSGTNTGDQTFLTLGDTPIEYTNKNYNVPSVTSDEDALEFNEVINFGECQYTARDSPDTPSADYISVYLTSSGTTPNKILEWKIKNESGEEVILSSLKV